MTSALESTAGGLFPPGHVALVTGGGQGIGAAIAKLFAAHSVSVVIASRSVGSDLALAIKTGGGQALFVQTDVSDRDSIDRAVRAAVEAFGKIDILVNNAAVAAFPYAAPVAELSSESWHALFEVNLDGCLWFAQRVAQHMIDRRIKGRIVNISSIVAVRGAPGLAAYQTAKRGLIGLTEAMAIDLAPHHINVNCVVPGYILTRHTVSDNQDARWRSRFLDSGRIPARRMGAPEEVAGVVLFLSSALSDYVVGQSIVVDGGLGITLG